MVFIMLKWPATYQSSKSGEYFLVPHLNMITSHLLTQESDTPLFLLLASAPFSIIDTDSTGEHVK